jgi:hypothetical protein
VTSYRFEVNPISGSCGQFAFRSRGLSVFVKSSQKFISTSREFLFTCNGKSFLLRGGIAWPYEIKLISGELLILEFDNDSKEVWRSWKSCDNEFQNQRSKADCCGNYHRYELRHMNRLVSCWFRSNQGKVRGVARLKNVELMEPILIAVVVASMIRWDSSMS